MNMNNYRIEFSHVNSDGIRKIETDECVAASASEAVRKIRTRYKEYGNIYIEDVWREDFDCWSHVEKILWEE